MYETRLNVWLSEEDALALKVLAGARGHSRANEVRLAVSRHVAAELAAVSVEDERPAHA